MRKLVFLATMLVAATGFGAMIEADMMELRLTGNLDFDNPEGHVETALDLGYGYFIVDDVEVGGLLGFANDGSDAGLGAGAFSEVMFDLNYPVAPFVGAALQFKFGDYYPHSHLLVDFNAGARFFMTEYLAISGQIFYDLASDDVYVNNEESKNHDAGMKLGLSCYF